VYTDLTRPALRAAQLQRALGPDGWRVEVRDSVDSTNALVEDRARGGEPAGLVVVAEHQRAGRGRQDRAWVSPPRAGLTFSVLLTPSTATDAVPALGWVPLFGGLAVATALREVAGVPAVLKWPNDVLARERKICGVLARSPGAGVVVLGIGLNVTTRSEELPDERASSLQLAGATTTDRGLLLRAVLRTLKGILEQPERSAVAYRELCATLGRQVRLELPGGSSRTGTADAVDDDGRLVVDGAPYSAGDVVHLRGAD